MNNAQRVMEKKIFYKLCDEYIDVLYHTDLGCKNCIARDTCNSESNVKMCKKIIHKHLMKEVRDEG